LQRWEQKILAAHQTDSQGVLVALQGVFLAQSAILNIWKGQRDKVAAKIERSTMSVTSGDDSSGQSP
jgi:hypothetical protein